LFVDADVAVHSDTLANVANTFARQPWIAATFGCYDDSPAATQFVSQYKNLFHHFVHQHGQEEGSTFWSACGAIRRDIFRTIGGFDEDYPTIEDIELGYRLRAAGHSIVLDRAIQVTHLKRWTLRGMIESDLFDRGIPWTRLMLQERHVLNDLNLRTSQRVSALLACLMVVHVVTAPSGSVSLASDSPPGSWRRS
jgi:GT2 family glycosyltransferase